MIDLGAPTALTGKELESFVLAMAAKYEERREACFGRYGVQAARMKDDWQILQSLPDIEGVLARSGRQVIFDCKVCSQASFKWVDYRAETKGSKSRQLKHLRRRSRFGAICFFLMHWNERILKTKVEHAETILLPVRDDDAYWDDVDGGTVRVMTREECRTMGVVVNWEVPERCRKPLPAFLEAVSLLPWLT